MEIRTLAAGIGFTEGPVWHESEGLLVTSMSRGVLYSIDLDGGDPEVWVETGGGPNGLALGRDGTVYVAQNGAATIKSRSERPTSAGIQVVRGGVIEDFIGDQYIAPNDLVLGPEDGKVYFTDPTASPPRVRTLDLDSGEVDTLIEGIEFPNGLAFGLDLEELFVADSETGNIFKYRVVDGSVSEPEVFASDPAGNPDGIAFDVEGNLYVANFATDEIAVYDPRGVRVESLPTGAGTKPTNCCFAGPGLATLVVTAAAGGRVLALPGEYPGLKI
jgi:gluconolactonase